MVTVNQVFRDFEIDGVPSSGAHKPLKTEIRELLSAIVTGGSNGLYDFVPASNVGAGTPNAIQAMTAIAIPATPLGALIAVNVYEANTGSPVTIQFNGGAIYTVKTASGNDIAPSGLTAGMVVAGYVSGSTFRLLSDQASSAVLAAAEAAQAAAEAAAASVVRVDFQTVTYAITQSIPLAQLYVRTAGYSTAGDGGGALYKRVGTAPSHPGYFQSADGAYWEIAETVITPQMIGVVADTGTDQVSAITNWLAVLSTLQRKGYGPAGVYSISYMDQTYTDSLEIECHKDAVFKGLRSYQRFAGNGSTTAFTITDFSFYAAGINVDIVNASTGVFISQLTEGVDYTVSGATVTLSVAPSSGQTVLITGTKALMQLRGPNALPARFSWRGGRFDVSERGYSFVKSSGSGLTVQAWDSVEASGTYYYAADDHEQAKLNFVGDSGLTLIECINCNVYGNVFQGFPDLGLYMTGNSSTGPEDDGGDISIYGNSFIACSTGLKVTRQANNSVIAMNIFRGCAIGVIQGLTGSPALPSGRNQIINQNFFKNTGSRALDLRAMPRGAIVTDNFIEDFGFNLDGTTPYAPIETGVTDPNPIAISLQGVPGTMVRGNRIGFREWAPSNNQRGVQNQKTTYADGSDALPVGIAVNDNYIQGVTVGIIEIGADTFNACTYLDNKMDGVTTPITTVGASTRFSYQKIGETVMRYGKGSASWLSGPNTFDPVVSFAGVSATVTYSTRRCSFTRNPETDEVTVRFQLQMTMTHTATTQALRISIPYDAVGITDDTGQAFGTVGLVIGAVTPPTGATSWALRALGGSSGLEVVALGNNAGLFSTELRGSNITSGSNFRIDGEITYIAA